ncbi:MAG: hypothetical protein ACK56F_04205 [bacterium]
MKSNENLLLRRLFAFKLVDLLRSKKKIMNFDESIFHQTSMNSYSWDLSGSERKRLISKPVAGFSILLAVSSEGLSYHSFLDGNSIEATVALFFIALF